MGVEVVVFRHYLLPADCSPLTAPLAARRSLLTAHCSLLAAHCSLLTAHCSLLTAHCSRLTTHYSLRTAHYSRLATHASRTWQASSLKSVTQLQLWVEGVAGSFQILVKYIKAGKASDAVEAA